MPTTVGGGTDTANDRRRGGPWHVGAGVPRPGSVRDGLRALAEVDAVPPTAGAPTG
ncbi:hypothetical protein [Streptomyces sp. SM14]|uniref:hypothetical protein n=1 Tax=Streptomyces sp. SM14 TaxID=1736045 RepID=UPI0015E16D7A|nr:hypothetical protein [Streptomyces sp. SM14]